MVWASTGDERACSGGAGYDDVANPLGCSRDHILSIVAGWNDGVPPQLLRHPANCRWITQEDNAAKGRTDRNAGLADVEALFVWIESYEGAIRCAIAIRPPVVK